MRRARPDHGAGQDAPPSLGGAGPGGDVPLSAPWILLLHLEPRSIARFVAVAADFPDFARAYAYEEVGKYYRKAKDFPAQEMYERCMRPIPAIRASTSCSARSTSCGRTWTGRRTSTASRWRRTRRTTWRWRCWGRWPEAQELPGRIDWFQKLVELRKTTASAWELLGYAASRAGQAEELARAFVRRWR